MADCCVSLVKVLMVWLKLILREKIVRVEYENKFTLDKIKFITTSNMIQYTIQLKTVCIWMTRFLIL